MPVYRLPAEIIFPPPEHAEPDGLLAVGGDLCPERLLLGLASGIFPWYSDGQPILWFSPDPRCVLEPGTLHISRSLRRSVRRRDYTIRLDTDFAGVIAGCKRAVRPGQRGTWITDDMERAYMALHELGHAHSVEAWRDGRLVGGLYGVALGGLFAGESMYALEPDASKVALVWLEGQLRRWQFGLIDCQVRNDHLARLGAVELPRAVYLERLKVALRGQRRVGSWELDDAYLPDPLCT